MNPAAIVLILSVSCYAPASGDGISGGMTTASGAQVQSWIAACPRWLPFGTVIDLPFPHPDGQTQSVVCGDRFADMYTNGAFLDISLAPVDLADESAESRRNRIAQCMQFGRQSHRITAVPPPSTFKFRWGKDSLAAFEPRAHVYARINKWEATHD